MILIVKCKGKKVSRKLDEIPKGVHIDFDDNKIICIYRTSNVSSEPIYVNIEHIV